MTADTRPTPGQPIRVAPQVDCILAPNPSPMTYHGTNTYLVGQDSIAVVDPGPDSPAHLAAVTAAIAGRPVSHIIVTHSHLDHSPLARPLAQQTGAPVLAFGTAQAGRSAIMRELAAAGAAGGGEGVDHAFVPDVEVADGAVIRGTDWSLDVIHTPGHMGNHICLGFGSYLFSGDHVMGWASSLVSPPDGDLTDFMMSLDRLGGYSARHYLPGHGAPVMDGQARVAELRAHRLAREAQVLDALTAGPAKAADLTARIYHDVPQQMWPAATRNLLAHLIDLAQRGLVTATPRIGLHATYALN